MNKLFIIGLDGLEFDLVEKWHLEDLKQKEYGKVDLGPALVDGYPISPPVWTSFMTGKPKKEHGVTGFKWNFPFYDVIYKMPKPFIFEDILSFLGFSKGFPDRKKIKTKTFVDELGDMFTGVNVPIYDFSFNNHAKVARRMGVKEEDIRHFVRNWDKVPSATLLKSVITHSGHVLDETFDKIGTDWTVFFTYFHWIDSVQHVFYMNEKILKEEYKRACGYVKAIKKRLEPDTLVLIVSDHGADMEGGHSCHGFYSLSERRGLESPKITDFYDFIMKEAEMPTTEDAKKIKAKLKKLGYL